MKISSKLSLVVVATFLTSVVRSQESVEGRLRALADQNQRLQQQVQAQQQLIEELRAEVGATKSAGERNARDLRGLADRVDGADNAQAAAPTRSRDHEVRVSGEAGLAMFKTGSAGSFPNAEFRVDDAKVFVEAPIKKDVYVFAGLNLLTRETNEDAAYIGEFYVDFENVLGAWRRDWPLTVRAGRFNIPFGEEYQVRGPLDNSLISHSLADVWGYDEGVEIFGGLGPMRYVLAVQNGGDPILRDYTSDKSVTARLEYDPQRWLHLSASAMRTGDINAKNDVFSALWFGNGFFRAVGSATTTTNFSADLAELDAATHWKGGSFKANASWVKFDDDDSARSNVRRLRYYALEGVQDIGSGVFAAARFSELRAPRGYPLVGWGNFGTFMYSSAPTTYLQRLSLGLGYHLSEPLVWKFEYAFERGRLTNGASRDHENLLSTELGMRF